MAGDDLSTTHEHSLVDEAVEHLHELAAKKKRRKRYQHFWITVVVGYAALRALVINKTFGAKHGINPWWYLLVDACAAAVEGWATGRAVGHAIDRESRPAWRFGLLAGLMFIVPDIYIFIVGDELPWPVFVVIGVIVVVTGTLTVVSVVRKVRSGLRERHERTGSPTLVGAPTPE